MSEHVTITRICRRFSGRFTGEEIRPENFAQTDLWVTRGKQRASVSSSMEESHLEVLGTGLPCWHHEHRTGWAASLPGRAALPRVSPMVVRSAGKRRRVTCPGLGLLPDGKDHSVLFQVWRGERARTPTSPHPGHFTLTLCLQSPCKAGQGDGSTSGVPEKRLFRERNGGCIPF